MGEPMQAVWSPESRADPPPAILRWWTVNGGHRRHGDDHIVVVCHVLLVAAGCLGNRNAAYRVSSTGGGRRYADVMSGPHRLLVAWGNMGRFDFVAEVVEAWDPDEAMVTAAALHPELPRPRVAVLTSGTGPPPFARRSEPEWVEPE